MIFNKSTIINKTNNNLSPTIMEHEIPRYMTLESQVLPWDSHKNVAVLNKLIGSQPSSLDNWIFKGNAYANAKNQYCLGVNIAMGSGRLKT